MNIVLIGYRCSGKTTVGKILGRKLGMGFVDTDARIEAIAGCPIDQLVSDNGWNYFRKIEKTIIRQVAKNDNQVIATGGGVVLDEDNVDRLKRKGWVVWLDGKADVLRERMARDIDSGSVRPSLSGGSIMNEIEDILGSRIEYYDRASDHVVDTNDRNPDDVSEAIILGMSLKRKSDRGA
jgi:shikimate kinase